MRQCTKCKKHLQNCDFYLRSDNRSERSHCKRCTNSSCLDYYNRNSKTNRLNVAYKYNLKVNYGLSVDLYNEMFHKQAGKCTICSAELENRFLGTLGKRSVVDHDHQTGKVRSLLCNTCNTGLGSFSDDTLFLLEAIKYIEAHRN